MPKEIGWNTDYQMPIFAPRDPGMNHLRDLRRRAEKGEFGPKPLSVPKGENVFRLTSSEIKDYAMQQADIELPFDQKMRAHIAANGE